VLGWLAAAADDGTVSVVNAVPADGPAGKAVAAADAAVATLRVPATAMMVSLFRFRVMIRSRDKVTLRLIAHA
jgi:hypothetical protein